MNHSAINFNRESAETQIRE